MDTISFLAPQFGLSGPFKADVAPSGLLHKTFFVQAKEGQFVFQNLHSVVQPETCEDEKTVCDYGREQGLPVPEFLVTRKGKPWYRADNGSLWRVMKRLPGVSHDTVQSPKEAYAAGELLGKFHAALSHFSYEYKGSIPHFHDTPFIFEQFKKTIEAYKKTELFNPVSIEVAYLFEQVPQVFLPKDLPRQIIHGDPKISNFLFENSQAAGLIDFDTLMNYTALVDIGDALRSWCNTEREDAPKPRFDQEVYKNAVAGYESAAILSERECSLIPQAFRLITLELATRFLKDYFEDSYFGWDPARFGSRREHNLARARNQIALYRQVV
jgi:Ser/Thr protein kinase RdoA (MazF antagonist)